MAPNSLIRTIYLYLITAITIVMTIIAAVNVVKISLEYIFDYKLYDEIGPRYECQDELSAANMMGRPMPVIKSVETAKPLSVEDREECLKKAEEINKERAANERKREIIWSLAMLIVALPLYFYHWKTIQKDHKD